MKISELYTDAVKQDFVDLQALIMFLTVENDFLSMQDDTLELDRYFLEKHEKKMNKILAEYKHKMGMRNAPLYYKVFTYNKTYYVKVENESQIIELIKHSITNVEFVDEGMLMDLNGKNIKLKDITNKLPAILGENSSEQKYKLRGK